MKKTDLKFKDEGSFGSFIMHCLFKAPWEDGAEEYNKFVKGLIRKAKDTDDFVKLYLDKDTAKSKGYYTSQAYQVMLESYDYSGLWKYFREMLGEKRKYASSDAGSLKVGNDDFTILIPNGHGDGATRYAILNEDEYYGHRFRYFTQLQGKFNIYSSDCGDEIAETIEGVFGIYIHEGMIALVKRNEED